ncbi:aminomethyltransferase [Amphibacillus marinus]|uniref:Aminomethyltransferase n=1 Tax=Amphibacillus marinus TaxID=872970 RepID=A0A1H8ITZ1_9BACI|nr:glycine cleavage system aminomethyltransferase GcvT [Amphibacillus marinus]SEN72034.1 aminomethyltransferase [Amphibacillus marinus]
MSQDALKRTPLFPLYEQYGAKVINFGGWALPVHFSSIIDEHQAVRGAAGLFDVSHMGEFLIEGHQAESFLNYLLTNDVTKISINQAQYTAMCYPDGGTVDDLLVYKLADDRFLLVVNAANIEKDFNWVAEHASRFAGLSISNISDQMAQLAIQGPQAEQILQQLTKTDLSQIKGFHFLQEIEIANISDILVSRTGYTGEDGFELYLANSEAPKLWQALLAANDAIMACGLGARDTLRFEARLALYGQELSDKISPLEAGISFTVKLNKPADFIGKTALAEQKAAGLKRKLVGVELLGRGIPRHDYRVLTAEGTEIGVITSGTHSPSLKKHLGLALINTDYSEVGTTVYIEIRNKLVEAKIVKTPFLTKK